MTLLLRVPFDSPLVLCARFSVDGPFSRLDKLRGLEVFDVEMPNAFAYEQQRPILPLSVPDYGHPLDLRIVLKLDLALVPIAGSPPVEILQHRNNPHRHDRLQ